MTGWTLIFTLLACTLIGYWAGWCDARDDITRRIMQRLKEEDYE